MRTKNLRIVKKNLKVIIMLKCNEISSLERALNTKIEVTLTSENIIFTVGNKCKLLSHMLHRLDLDIHCTKDGVFTMNFDDYNLTELLTAFNLISKSPELIIGFVEKYKDNSFMMDYTFNTTELVKEGG